jgi:carbon-monoxide dehydrogenase large subunit
MNARFNPSRQEDLPLITGQGHFTADHNYPGMLHAYVIRSVHAHARITHLDMDAVRTHPGVRWVVTSADLKDLGAGTIANPVTAKGKAGEDQIQALMPLLAEGTVRFVGQPIAMVFAVSALVAQDAAELADIEYEELEASVDPEGTTRPSSVQLHANAPRNLSVHFASGDAETVNAAFAKAAHTSQLRVLSQRLMGVPMEPRAVVAIHDGAAGVTTVHTPHQGILGMRNFLALASGAKPESLQIDANDVGGSFGLRGGAYTEHAALVLAARHLDCPVSWVGSRSEIFLSDWHGRALILNGQIALDREGRILAIRFKDRVDAGAYNCMMSTFIGTRNIAITMGGVYQVPALYMESEVVYTNTTPVSAYRGAGRPDIAYAIERLVDFAAHEHGFDPVALRRRNFIPEDAFPYQTANGSTIDTCLSGKLLDRALELSDYAGFEKRRAHSLRQGKYRGIGLSTFLEASGAGNAPKDQAWGEFNANGFLYVYGVTGPSGQGHATSFARIIEKALGWPADRVRYEPGNANHPLLGNGTGGSRSLYGAGSAILAMSHQMLASIQPHASKSLGVAIDQVRFENGVWIADGRTLTTAQVVDALASEEKTALNALGEASSGATYPNGCHIAEVEIDPSTGVTDLLHYYAVDDLGQVISPLLVRGQVHGGVVQGWGQAFCEQVVYDQQGQLLTGSFMDYAMPRAGCVPHLTNETYEVRTQLNLLGSKGVGESGCTGSLPALANAVMSALRPYGIHQMDMPFTGPKIWAALQKTRAERSS